MGRMAEAFQEQDERDNESGMDLCEAYHAEIEAKEWDTLNDRVMAAGISEGFNQIFTGDRS